MKKRWKRKLAAGLSAAAAAVLGASFASFAGNKGTWMMVDGEWYCYDSDGELYENTFCESNGIDFYVGDDGTLVRSDWVEYDGDSYFVNSSGAKLINDWRLTTPMDDPYGEEGWYYFQSGGVMAANKKLTIKGSTYFFDDDGRMLTGWVTADDSSVQSEETSLDKDHSYYCDPDTGASLRSAWVCTAEPGADEDDPDLDEYWYYLKSTGKPATGKNSSIGGQTYLFDDSGRMLCGWVAYNGEEYFEIDGEDDEYVLGTSDLEAVYYCGGADDGHMKKNKWMKLWRPEDTWDEDWDEERYWYWIQSDGKIYIPTDSDAVRGATYYLGDGEMEYQDEDMTELYVFRKKINSKNYFFNQAGEMLHDFVEIATASGASELDPGMYYLGGADDGSMKTGSQSVKDENEETFKFYFGTGTNLKTGEETGVGITGNKSGKLYYKGLLIKAEDYNYQPVVIDGHTFIVNGSGSIQHSQTEYQESGDTLINTKTDEESGYRIVFRTEDDQWKYSIDEAASSTLDSSVGEIDLFAVMMN